MPGLIFAKSLIESSVPAAAADGDYSTFTNLNSITLNLDDSKMFDHFFIKSAGVTSYTLSLDGTQVASRTVPAALTGVPELGSVSLERHGYKHDLFEVPDFLNYRRQHALASGNLAPHGATEVLGKNWVASNNNDQVYVYDSDWNYESAFSLPNGNTQPRGLAFHSGRNLVISVDNTRKLFLINPSTRALVSQHTLTANPEGVLYFKDIDEIWCISRANSRIDRHRGSDVSWKGRFNLDTANNDSRGGCYLSFKKLAAVLDSTHKQLFLYDAEGDLIERVSFSSAQTIPRAVFETETGVNILDNGNDAAWVYEWNRGDQLTVALSGSGLKTSDVMVLKKLAELRRTAAVAHQKVDRDSELLEVWDGEAETELISGVDRFRWLSNYTINFDSTDTNYEFLLDLIEDNEEVVFAKNPAWKPWDVYRAIFPLNQYDAPYLCKDTRAGGNSVSFEIAESRPVGDAWYTLDKFNTNSSGQGLMFFSCAHLGQNGRVDDNDYKTFSTQTTYTFDVDGVSHIWLKVKGVTSYQVQTLVSDTWTTQQTITPAQKAYRGWEHSLTELTTRLPDSQIRLVFTGTNLQVNEIFCLDLGGEILTDAGTVAGKSNRTGVIHEGQQSELSRGQVGSQRMKWAVRTEASFGALDDFTSEDFLDWANLNPNFVLAYTPDDTPWRVYPSTWGTNLFPGRFLSKVLQVGESISFHVIER